MRQVKALLAVSLSVFLLAMSFALISGRAWAPAEAHAQSTTPFTSLVKAYSPTQGRESYLAITSDGAVYGFHVEFPNAYEPGTWAMTPAVLLGSASGGPVPTANSSIGDLKASFGVRK